MFLTDDLHLRRESLQINQHDKNEERTKELREIISVRTSEGMLNCLPYGIFSEKEMNQSDESAFKLYSKFR